MTGKGVLGEGDRLAPTRPAARLEVLDGLRGFAILGILSANLQVFISPEVWGIPSPNSGASAGAFEGVYGFLVSFLAEGKFITALAFLLGLGLALQARRSRTAGRSPFRFLSRRLLVLGVIGLGHALLVWSGDVLLFYAVLGFPFLLFVGRSPAILLKWAGWILAVLLAGGLLISGGIALAAYLSDGTSTASAGSVSQAAPGFVTEAVRNAHGLDGDGSDGGGYSGQILARIVKLPLLLPASLLFSGPMVFSMMLLGAAAANSGEARRLVARNSDGHNRVREAVSRITLGRVVAVGIGVGLPVNLFYAVVQRFPGLIPPLYDQALLVLAGALWMVGAPALALGWMALLAWLLVGLSGTRAPVTGAPRTGWPVPFASFVSGLSARLAAVGRMALTNYLAQSIIMVGVLYGFGLYGEIPYVWAALLMAGIWTLELAWSKPYLQRFAYGPVEWIWRRLSY